jgi:hypothetical protein
MRHLLNATLSFAALLAVILSLPAFAQDATPLPTATNWEQVLITVVLSLIGLLGTIATTVLLPMLRRWLAAKTQDTNASAAIQTLAHEGLRLDAFVEAGVAKAWDVFERDMKEAAADGKVSPEELSKAKTDVLEAVKAYLGSTGMNQLSAVLGIGGSLLEDFLKAQIEKKVQAAQAAGSLAAAGVTTGPAAAAALSAV